MLRSSGGARWNLVSACFCVLYWEGRRGRFSCDCPPPSLPPLALFPSLVFSKVEHFALPGSFRRRSGAADLLWVWPTDGALRGLSFWSSLRGVSSRRKWVICGTQTSSLTEFCIFFLPKSYRDTSKMSQEQSVGHVKLVGVWNPSPRPLEVSDSVLVWSEAQLCGCARTHAGGETPGNRNGSRWLFFSHCQRVFFFNLTRLALCFSCEWTLVESVRSCLR